MKTKYVWALGLWWLGVHQAGPATGAVSAHSSHIDEPNPDVKTLILANPDRMQTKRWTSTVGGE